MTDNEKKNYGIALFLSIVFHVLLITISFTRIFYNSPGIEVVAAEVVEFSNGTQEVQAAPTPKVEEVKEIKEVKENPKVEEAKEKEVVKPASEKPVKPQPVKEEKKEPKPEEVIKETEKPKEEKPAESSEKPKENVKEKQSPTTETSKPVADSKNGTKENGTPAPESNVEPVVKGPISKSLGDGSGMVAKRGSKYYYPKNAMNKGVEGDVIIRIYVRANGSQEKVEVIKSSGEAGLDNAAKGYVVREWHFKPNDVDYTVDLAFHFELKSASVNFNFLNSFTRP